MADVQSEAEAYVAGRGDGEETLRHLLAVDAEHEEWTFDDLELDSGTFGEVVSRELVEGGDGGYVVTDRGALAAAVGEESLAVPDDDAGDSAERDRRVAPLADVGSPTERLRRWVERREVDRMALGGLALALLAVVAFRSLTYSAAFRDGSVVMLGNDPYAFHYWTGQLLAEYGTFDPTQFGALREEVATTDVTLYVFLWALVSLAPGSADTLLAWYPVVAAVGTGLAVYGLATQLTPDRRVALGAVVMLAITPVHAYRTTVGFADHHAFDYLLVGVVLAALSGLARERVRSVPSADGEPDGASTSRSAFRSRRGWALAGLLGTGLFVQVFAWRGSPILVAPLALYVTALAAVDVASGDSPALRNRYLLAGLALGALLSLGALWALGWGSTFRGYLPGAVLAGTLAVFGTAEVVRRLDVSARVGGAALTAAMALVALGLWLGTALFDRLVGRAESWVTGALGRSTAGTDSLVSTELGTVVGPILVFGLVLFVAVPVLIWLTSSALRGKRVPWLAPAVYAWYLFGWTLVFVRFGGSLAVALAPFAGYAFVFLPARIEVFRSPVPSHDDVRGPGAAESTGSDRSGGARGPPVPKTGSASARDPAARANGGAVPGLQAPGRDTVAWILAFFLVIGSFSFVQIPVKGSQLAVGDGVYETATWIDDHAERTDREYPENFVLSPWDENRIYNYHVNGRSANYTYAEDNYGSFVADTDARGWYQFMREDVGYVVIPRNDAGFGTATTYSRLFEAYGSETADHDAVDHYRAVYVASGGNRRVFSLVPGAVLTGTGPPDAMVTVETPVDLVNDEVTYRRTVETTESGHFAVRVPQPGTYESEEGTADVAVSESDVRAGGFAVEGGSDASLWRFDERRGTVAFDRRGTNHGFVLGAEWTDEGTDGALAFDGERVLVPDPPNVSAERGVTLAARFRADGDVDYRSDRRFATLAASAPSDGANLRPSGYGLAVSRGRIGATFGDGDGVRHLEGPPVDDGEWHTAAMRFADGHLELYLDGELVERRPFDGGSPPQGQSFYLGTAPGSDAFAGSLDDVAFADRAVESPTTLLGNETG